jgi:O-antigen ligase
MRPVLLALAALVILAAPFREGGRDPLALLILHTLALAFIVMALVTGGERPPRRSAAVLTVAILAGLFLLGAGLAATRAAYPLAALLGLVDAAMATGLFLAAEAAARDGRTLRFLRNATVVSTGAQACLALLRYARGGVQAAGVSFLNPNHLAAFLNIGLLLSVTAAEEAFRLARRRLAAVWSVVAAIHLMSIALLSSRGAFMGLTAALLTLALLRLWSWRRARLRSVTVALAAVLAIGCTMLSLWSARSGDPYRHHRLRIWKAAAGMLMDHPFQGIGPGMFGYVSPRYNFPNDSGPLRFERTFGGAHSGVLTLAVEDGIPAAGVLLAAAVMTIVALLRASRQGAGAASLGIGLAVLALLVQGLVEDLQERPALVLVPALLLGAGLGALRRGRTESGEGLEHTARAPESLALGPALSACVATAVTYLFLVAIALPYAAHRAAETARREGSGGLDLMRSAARLNPLHPEYRHDLAMAALNSGPPSPERYAEAFHHLSVARRLKPIDHRFPLLLGRLEALAGERLFKDATAMERATALYREAILLGPLDPLPRLELAHHLVAMRGEAAALETLRQALSLEPNFVRARVLEASILVDLGRRGEALASGARLEESLKTLAGFVPESGYGRAVVMDVPADRRRLAAALSTGGEPPPIERTR